MTGKSASVRELLRESIEELEGELARLRRALRALEPSGERRPTRTTRARRPASARAPTGARAARGERQKQFLAAVRAKPGAKASEIAREIGVSTSQANGLARRLHAAGQLRKRRGGRWAART